jgi:biotin carboxyl carrier protein
MKLEVNGNILDVEIAGSKAIVDGRQVELKYGDGEIAINGKKFYLDYFEEGEPSLMIINGMSYVVSKATSQALSVRELRAPIGGQIIEIFAAADSRVVKGQLLVVLEAMKMENQIKSPVSGKIREVKVKKDQLVKTGDILLTFE